MCLGVPGEIVSIEEGVLRHGQVRFGEIKKRVCLAYVPEAAIGSYVIVHAGFAISELDAEEAKKTLELLAQLESASEGG